MTDMKERAARDKVFGLLRASGAQMVDVKFSGILGRWHHITLPSDQFTDRIFEDGVPFDGSSIPGLTRVESSDLLLLPDPESSFLDPFKQVPTLSIVADVAEAETKTPFARDPRSVARRACAHLRATDLADDLLMRPEFEFYVFEYVRYRNRSFASGYVVESAEAPWNTYRQPADGYQPATVNPRKGGYHALPPNDSLDGLRTEISVRLKEAGIGVRYHHHESGGAGQCEIEILPLPLLRAADAVQLVKYFVRMAAQSHGRIATFMPKPIYNEAGSGMHVHQHMVKGGSSLFYDPDGWERLSPLALNYIGGLLTHAPALTALTNPSTMSFKRLVPGFEAPVSRTFGTADRTAAVRIPKASRPRDDMRVEYRPPDATANIYLSLSAMLMAGLDGIKNGIDPSGFASQKGGGQAAASLPGTLDEALAALEADHGFLLQGGVFTEDLLEDWTRLKRVREIEELRRRPHPYEFYLYLDA